VLVIQGAEAGLTGPDGSRSQVTPNYTGILQNKRAIENARGSRTFLSGSDADFHAARGDTGHTPPFVADYKRWDGALGYVVNAVDWAASGTGLGVVAWYHGEVGPDAYWWTHPDSFLKEELDGYIADFKKDLPGDGRRENTPIISADTSQHPLNAGLTSRGLSHWQWSFHGGFKMDIASYGGIIHSARSPDLYLAVARDRFPFTIFVLATVIIALGLLIFAWRVFRPPMRGQNGSRKTG
jgi:hypothetical protein